jgi:hypothetical protein
MKVKHLIELLNNMPLDYDICCEISPHIYDNIYGVGLAVPYVIDGQYMTSEDDEITQNFSKREPIIFINTCNYKECT